MDVPDEDEDDLEDIIRGEEPEKIQDRDKSEEEQDAPCWKWTTSPCAASPVKSFAQIHGYDYKFYHAQHMKGYYDTWIRPHLLASLLRDNDYDFVMTMDADVTITHKDVPLEWLFNRWNITERTSIALPWDVETQIWETDYIRGKDSRGLTVLNAGVVIVQNLPHTLEILQAWGDCPTETRYEGCAHWKTEWSHEQRAFSEYIRYDFNPDGDNIVPIACDDAMSWPGATEERPGPFNSVVLSDCNGNFLRHHTWHKERPRGEFQDAVMQLMIRLLQDKVKQNMDTILTEERKERKGGGGIA
ncbi:uncharacterized protein MYCGRDRAFT_92195 [Zymoseptoria tritici IPO323]|uniref:Nucleotide-diphospho-sugar transferase domain-containing protein n=1 Tax=Zymoseptoria tritici (strain CBS 115943 / IPO323) TaxID=336722 RepID=F9X7J1_ZYMTI|nr:uncharacterized protein MYCGRDRAFT_92195 [Zymoseptoria tritici IPO323]EGP89107.1 hypothetical protein MYCGRDRAFT_92195 [Zymoseptoria tritici IPO323]